VAKKLEHRRAVSQGDWLTIIEAAEYLGMSVKYVQRRKLDGTLAYNKYGTSVRFHKSTLDAHIEDTRRVGHHLAGQKAGR
jgi:excisionase family DNA binding protein